MALEWRPTEDHEHYSKDPAYLERRFGVPPLRELRLATGVVGVARVVVVPSSGGESIYTLVYRANDVEVEARRATHSLWESLSVPLWRPLIRGDWVAPAAVTRAMSFYDLSTPLNGWQSVKEAARSAPTVTFAIIDGQKCHTLDGVSYRHHVVDVETDIYAVWDNPAEDASNHVEQVRLVAAYEQLFRRCSEPNE
ncbi:MAG TPA: hypothetical protein VF796_14765 [Humisphaera sp.]